MADGCLWMVIEALVTIASGVIAGCLTLTAFGLDSVIELISAGVLICRLTEELRRGEELSRHAERIASPSGGASLWFRRGFATRDARWLGVQSEVGQRCLRIRDRVCRAPHRPGSNVTRAAEPFPMPLSQQQDGLCSLPPTQIAVRAESSVFQL